MGFRADLDTVALPAVALVAMTWMFLYLKYPVVLYAFPIIIGYLVITYKNVPCDPKHVATFFSGFKVGGHRGSPKNFPENSMAGFEQAKREGADLIEFDVALTKDGAAVLLHDDDLDRTTDMIGPIRNHTLAELANCNIAAKFKRLESGTLQAVVKEGLPTLEGIVQWSVKNHIRMLFDVKDSDVELVNIIANLFEKYRLYDKAIVCSFFPSVVYRIKQGNQKILTGLTWRQKFFSHHDIENTLPRYYGVKHYLFEVIDLVHVAMLKTITPWFLGADLLLTNNLDISQQFVNEQRSWGRHVAVWTVNDMAEMHWMLETLKVPILTDHPYFLEKANLLEKLKTNNYKH